MTQWHTSYELKVKGSENLLVHRSQLPQKCYNIGRGGDRGAGAMKVKFPLTFLNFK